MTIKERITRILDKEYPEQKPWKAFIYWWLAAHGHNYDVQSSSVRYVDGPNDGGIDVIAFPLQSQMQKHVFVLQSKFFGQPPTPKDLKRFIDAIAALNGPPDEFNEWLGTCRPELHSVYLNLRESRKHHRYILIAPCDYPQSQKKALSKFGIEVEDAPFLEKLERNFSEGKTPRLEEVCISGVSPIRRVGAQNGTSVWLFTAPAREFAYAYRKYGNDLFAGNIRYALKGQTAKKVRDGMWDTLQEAPHEFLFSHNGITISGENIVTRGKTAVMRSATIVNGAQTVSYLGSPSVLKILGHNPARVIVKFVQANKPELLSEIESKVACRSNNQNKVDQSDLMIELSQLVSLQRYFKRHGFHLERKKGEQKLQFGQKSITKERLVQVLAAIGSSEGAVKAKSKQELFSTSAPDLLADYDSTEKKRAEALAWARVDCVFRDTANGLAVPKRKRRALVAQFAILRVFNRVLQSTQLKSKFLKAMAHWHPTGFSSLTAELESFLDKSCKAIISAVLQQSAAAKKNEPAFYKSIESLKPAVQKATTKSRKAILKAYKAELAG